MSYIILLLVSVDVILSLIIINKLYIDIRSGVVMKENEGLDVIEEIDSSDEIEFADPPVESVDEIKVAEEDGETVEVVSEIKEKNAVNNLSEQEDNTEDIIESKDIEELGIPIQSISNNEVEISIDNNNDKASTITISNSGKENVFAHSSLYNPDELETIESEQEISKRRRLALKISGTNINNK